MSRRIKFFGAFLVILLLVAAAGLPVQAEQQSEPAPAAKQPSMEEMQQMMEALASPGEKHQALNFYVGDWKAEIKMMMGPGEPQVSQGTARFEWILGGRYLQNVQQATFGGMPFEGRGLLGYDNGKQEYFDLWIDNMGTGYMAFTGGFSADGKTFTEKGSYFDPMMQREVTYRSVTQVLSPDQLANSMFTTGPDGSEMKVMEITYTR